MTEKNQNKRHPRTDKRTPEETFAPVFSGRQEKAQYRDPVLDIYKGNPCIEALPANISDKQLARLLTQHTPVTAAQRRLVAFDRDLLIEHIPRFYHPLAKAYQLHRVLQRMIRGGYVGEGRNPADLTFWNVTDRLAEGMDIDIPEPSPQFASAYAGATGGSLIGVSGMGKSRTVKELLKQLFPQVIYHEAYKGRPLPLEQVVWLYLECPSNASIKLLLLQFFWALDQILRTTYYASVTRNGGMSAENLIIPMANFSLKHALGVLIIDEIQNINQAASGGEQRFLNLLVKLSNWLGVPVFLMGTPEAMEPLTERFRMARRLSGQGDPKWDRMQPDDADWQMFVEALWAHQYLRKRTPLTPALCSALYRASTGITEVAIRVFMFAQRRAVAYAAHPNDEQLTPELLTSIPIAELGLVEPVLQALREGQEQFIDRVPDVIMTTPAAIKNKDVDFAPYQTERQTRNEDAHTTPTLTNQLLTACAEQPAELSSYERLKRAGFIRTASEFL